MQVKHLQAGLQVHIIDGPMQGFTATVIDPNVIPDGQPNQRKVAVDINGAGANGSNLRSYILPRQLDVQPVATAPAPMPVAVPTADSADLTVIRNGEVEVAEPITDPMHPAFDSWRPDPAIVKEYVSRTLPGGLSDIDYLLHLRDMRDDNGYSPNVAFVGETQSGKTMLVRVLAVLSALRDGMPKPYPVFTLNGEVGISSYDLFGQPSTVVIDGVETIVWCEGLVPLALKCGGFLYLDEWNAVASGQAVALHTVLDDRREFTNRQRALPIPGHPHGFMPETVKAHPNTWIISTINPGYKGTQAMAEASTNRFRWVPWDYDDTVEATLVPSATIRSFGKALREARAQRALTLPVGSSALRRLNEDCATFGVDSAMWSFTAMFPPAERERVQTIAEDRGFIDLLKAEYPNPVFAPAQDEADQPVVEDANAF